MTSNLRAVSIDTPRSDLPRVRNPTQHSYFIQIVPMKTWLGFLSFLRKESFPLSGIILSDESWPMNNLCTRIFLHYLNQLYKKCICFDVHRYRKYFVTWKTALNIKQTNTLSLWRNTSKEFVSWSKKIQGGGAGTWRTGCLKVTIFTYLHFANKTSSGKLTFKIQFVRTCGSSLKFSTHLDRRMTWLDCNSL